MAFAVTARHTGNNGQVSAQTFASNSVTPTASSLLLVVSTAENDGHATAQAVTISGGSLTYSNVIKSSDFAWDGSSTFALSCSLQRATVGGSPSAFAVTADHYSGTNLGYYSVAAVDITGHDTTTPVVQTKANGATSSGDTVSGTVTLDSTPTTTNLVVGVLAAGADGGGGFAAPTFGGQSMTQHHNQNPAAGYTQVGMWSRVITGGESSAVFSCSDMGGAVGNWAGCVVEIALAGGAPAGMVPRRRKSGLVSMHRAGLW